MRFSNNFLLFGLAATIAMVASPPALSQGLETAEIDALVLRTMGTFDVPGIAVGVVRGGELVYGKGHGVLQTGESRPVDADTLFAIASNTKAFTAAALAILVDEGLITWDDRVVYHLPQFRLADPFITSAFTIRDLLTHRSGLGPYSGDLMVFPETDFTREEIIARLRYLPMTTEFRAEFAYDNHLYMVAGEVLAAVAGMSWEDFVETRILGELGIEPCAATFSRIDNADNLATPHAVVEGKLGTVAPFLMETVAAAGSIWCNVNGMAAWVGVQLASGKTADGGSLFSEEQSREMWSAQTILPVGKISYEWNRTHFAAYGLGWGLSDFDGYKKVSHNGGLPGMLTTVTLLPELDLGVIVLTNQQSGAARSAITYQILKAYTEAESRDWVEVFAERAAERRARAETSVEESMAGSADERGTPSLALAAYAGTYTDPWRGDVTITEVDGKLSMKFSRTEGLNGEMHHHSHDIFVVRWQDRSLDADAYVKFSLDFEGAVDGMTMRAISPLTDPSYDFHDLSFVPKAEILASE